MIDRNRWQQLSALLDEVLALEQAERPGWMAALRARDRELAEQLEPMLGPEWGDAEATVRQPRMDVFEQHLAPALGGGAADGPASPAPQAGQRMGPWQLLYQIGSGGMGEVWLAARADGLFEAQAAIKLLRSDLPAAGLAARFARERAVLARLNHPAVARLLDAGIADGQAYLVLEYVVGRSLTAHARMDCPTVSERVRLLVRVAEAVDHAHAQLIVHRDLKPSNVMVTASGDPKLLDFGIAGLLDDGEPGDTDLTRQTGRGLTLGYAAPEQILGAPIGTAADVFSLGVMLFELLTGELPFAPRSSQRVAIERAVLHDEPQRFQQLIADKADPLADPGSPGRPQDAERALGDLEAVVAKALRKDPGERYGSVQALVDDLHRWLSHRPVSVRRDDWRHRSGLWLRRHAVLAGATTVVVASLSAGLVAATWQWRRAEASARQSDQITTYLTDLLATADPAQHGGQWPTVLQLLESSRKSLPDKFRDDPETRLRLLDVLAETYRALNRFDAAMPLFDEYVALAERQHGANDERTIVAKIDRGRSLQVQGLFDKALEALEPLRSRALEVLGPQHDRYQDMLYSLNACYTRLGRLDESERLLAELGPLVDAKYPLGHPFRLSHLNHVQVLRTTQGRLTEALAAMHQTQPFWEALPAEHKQLKLTLQRNTLAVQIRLAQFDGVEQRILALLDDGDRFAGPGNDWSNGLRIELVRYYQDTGQVQKALQVRQDNLARAKVAKVEHPAVLVPLRAMALLSRGLAHTDATDTLLREARALLQEMDTVKPTLGYGRAEAWNNLARLGLLLDNEALAADALARVRGDAGLHLDRDPVLASRLAQLDGELARLRGDLPRSRELLRERLRQYDGPRDQRVVPAWMGTLDLAYTQLLMGDAEAGQTLALAASRRPAGVPAGHPLDRAQAYLQARLVHGNDDAPPVRAAIDALAQTQARRPGQPAGAGRGSLGGVIL